MLSLIIEPAISLALFYLAYAIFLRRLTFFRANRYFLLAAVVFSLLLPHINFSPPVSVATYSIIIPEVTITGEAPPGHIPSERVPVNTAKLLMTIYIAGAVVLSLRLALRLVHLAFIIGRNRKNRYNNAIIVNLKSEQPPFSFLNYIFINERLYDKEERHKIIEHELVHINQVHSFDLLLLELLTIVQWFNPVAWLYRRSMLEIHEYLADEEIIRKGTNISFYQSLLLNLQLGREYFSPASNFNRSLTLNRIRMMTSIKPAAWKRTGFFILMPALVMLVLMCTKEEAGEAFAISEPLTGNYTTDNESGDYNYDGNAERMAAGNTPSEDGEVFFVIEEDGISGPPGSDYSQTDASVHNGTTSGDDITPLPGIIERQGNETGTFQSAPEAGSIEPRVSQDNRASYGTAVLDGDRGNQNAPPAAFPDPPHTSPEESEVFFIVEDMPDFRGGGQDAFRRYIAENLRYPQAAAENGIEGRVFVQFTVDADGIVRDATIVRGVDPLLDREAIRIVMASPRWNPGRQRGQPVNVAFTFPINFVLQHTAYAR